MAGNMLTGSAPVLDSPPASPPGAAAAPPSQDSQLKSLAPEQSADAGQGMQVAEITLKTGQAIGQGITMLSQIHPDFAPLGNQLMTMLRGGLRKLLEQGLGPSEPGQAAGGQGSPMSGLASMTSGMPGQEEGSPPAY